MEEVNKNIRCWYIQGPKGEKGAGVGATSFNAIIYAGYTDATDSRALTIK